MTAYRLLCNDQRNEWMNECTETAVLLIEDSANKWMLSEHHAMTAVNMTAVNPCIEWSHRAMIGELYRSMINGLQHSLITDLQRSVTAENSTIHWQPSSDITVQREPSSWHITIYWWPPADICSDNHDPLPLCATMSQWIPVQWIGGSLCSCSIWALLWWQHQRSTPIPCNPVLPLCSGRDHHTVYQQSPLLDWQSQSEWHLTSLCHHYWKQKVTLTVFSVHPTCSFAFVQAIMGCRLKLMSITCCSYALPKEQMIHDLHGGWTRLVVTPLLSALILWADLPFLSCFVMKCQWSFIERPGPAMHSLLMITERSLVWWLLFKETLSCILNQNNSTYTLWAYS